MSSWSKVSLGEIFDIARGGSPRPIDKFITEDPDGYNWIMIGDTVEGSKYISSTKKRILRDGLKKSRMVNKGDFLLTNSMSFGRPYIMKTSGCIHDGWLVLSPREDNVHPDFFYYLLGSNHLYQEFSRRAAGAVVKNLNTKLVRSVKVVLPPLEEQKRIAGILDAADRLRAKRRETLAELDTLLQSTFLELFGDPVTNPKGWEVKRIDEIFEVARGGSPRPIQNYLTNSDDGVNWIMIGDAEVNSRYITKTAKRINPSGLNKTRFVHSGDFLLTNSMSYGRPYILKTNGCIHDGWLVLSPKDQDIHPDYFYSLLSTDALYREFTRRAAGAVVKNLNTRLVRQVSVAVPPVELQHHFAAVVESIEKQKAKQRAHLAELDALFASLQSRAFNGEL